MKNQFINKILQETHDIYNAIAPDFSVTRAKWWHALDEFKNFAKEGNNILDLGCGNGRLATLFSKMSVDYLGIDNSEELIKIAQEKYKDCSNIRFEVGDIGKLALPKGHFDLIFVLAVLHHIPTEDMRLADLKEIAKLLSPRGVLIISNWNIFRIRKYWPMILDYRYKISRGVWSLKDAFIPWKPIGSKSRRYVHSFTKGEMKSLLKQAGLEVKDIYYENKGHKTSFFKGYNLMAIAKKK